MMFFNVPFAEYKFIFRAIDPVFIPAFADPLWRSVFGSALKQLSCVAENDTCDICLLKHQCDYSFLATGSYSPHGKTGITGNMKNIPNPHVFRCRIKSYSAKINRGNTFSAKMLLIGNANERLPAVIRAMVKTGMLGLGKTRPKFQLVEVIQTGPKPLERLILSHQQIIADGLPVQPKVPELPEKIRFSFQTPLLLAPGIDISKGFDLPKMMMQIVRRISSLQEAYNESPLEADYKQLKKNIGTQFILDANLNFKKRYSYGSSRKKFTAVRGELLMTLEHYKDFWPWLYLGQFFNVGKQASKGFGRYKLTSIEENGA